jgi:phosphatidyl-myo-inositol alpha-mannosyltransferase
MYHPRVPIEVIPNAFDTRKANLDVSPPDWWPRDEKKNIITVGRQDDKRKGFDRVIDEFALMKSVRDDLRLIVVGNGVLTPGLERQAAERGLREGEDVLFTRRYLSDEEYNQALVLADLAMFGSTGGEGFGRVILDAYIRRLMAMGYDIPGFREALGNGEFSLKADPKEPGSMARLGLWYLGLPEERKQELLDRAGAHAANFSADKIAVHQADFYIDTINDKRQRALHRTHHLVGSR